MRRRPLLHSLLAGTGLTLGGGILPTGGTARGAVPSRSSGLADSPPPLGRGSRVVAFAPGSWWEDLQAEGDMLQRRCRAAGWTLELPEATRRRWHWFAGTDVQRRDAWEAAWRDPSVAAVFCVMGGWGSARVLEAGWRPATRPLWLVGFSDASSLLMAQQAAGHGGAVHASCGGEEVQWQRLVALLRGQAVAPLAGTGWVAGRAQGPLVVTNLTVATSLIGTPWFPSLRGAVLVLEDVGEAPYRVDRMLTQWRTARVLEGVAAVGVGRFSWKPSDVLPGDLTMEEVLRSRLGDLGVPVLGQLPVGHGQPNLALPLGRWARLDADRGELTLL
jgi:muramoyltetrapeptide carboxypeptidase